MNRDPLEPAAFVDRLRCPSRDSDGGRPQSLGLGDPLGGKGGSPEGDQGWSPSGVLPGESFRDSDRSPSDWSDLADLHRSLCCAILFVRASGRLLGRVGSGTLLYHLHRCCEFLEATRLVCGCVRRTGAICTACQRRASPHTPEWAGAAPQGAAPPPGDHSNLTPLG